MSKKGKRLREFEMKNRDLSVTHSREEREGKKKKNSSAKSKPEVRKKKTNTIYHSCVEFKIWHKRT